MKEFINKQIQKHRDKIKSILLEAEKLSKDAESTEFTMYMQYSRLIEPSNKIDELERVLKNISYDF